MHALKQLIKRFLPASILTFYHLALARLAALYYGNPSEKLVVIGVTGTNGKSSTTQFIGRLLELMGQKVGWTTTAGFKIGDQEWENKQKMTMLGRFATQRMLRQMVNAGCGYAIIETSSQGVVLSRHVGINYDVAVFTNLTPEHIEAHGGFENYKKAKGAFFAHVAKGGRKRLGGREGGGRKSGGAGSGSAGENDGGQEKMAVVNIDDPHADYFLSFPFDQKVTYGLDDKPADYSPTVLSMDAAGTAFVLETQDYLFHPVGRFSLYNVLAAITVVRSLGFDAARVAGAVEQLRPIPGRFESIDCGQSFTVLVDYAYEPAALSALYDAIKLLPHKRIIHVTGSAGGGRDVSRRAVIGEFVAKHADIVVVTDEDPYDEDPKRIIDMVAGAAAAAGKTDGTDLYRISDRQEAIEKAMSLASPGDLVLLTGKGNEPVMAVAHGKKIPWDDRSAARMALVKGGYDCGTPRTIETK
ncbi:UDP-N-acetylmuramoyl-L-alanyl-D-glutamate--2,6-diaminopimelate ligase [Candidatus Uhrbacteria bacterium]|nr:UDP-N-acetylmuramoyl-L-alanyl-D-glutamate--2,6-diaminopimelate ligase [Candidatus Uhrbacteria bacterium]